jgi:hypothetical protein
LWIATVLSRALALPEGERKQLVHGLFNAALIVFDTIQYTGNSAVQLVITQNITEFQELLSLYPTNRVPVFLFGTLNPVSQVTTIPSSKASPCSRALQ